MSKHTLSILTAGLALLLLPAATPAWGANGGFGVADLNVTVVPAAAFLPAFDQASGASVEYATDTGGWVFKTTSALNSFDFLGPVSLPSGARLEAVLFEACDFDTGGANLSLSMSKAPAGSDLSVTNLGAANTGPFEAPGCDLFPIEFFEPLTIDNLAERYVLRVIVNGDTDQTKFRSVELHWRRQISPAPGTATFDDVPTGHPFFQHVEALAASGITGGCGGGDYCPDASLTRGQMAVFLAKALGLHWGSF